MGLYAGFNITPVAFPRWRGSGRYVDPMLKPGDKAPDFTLVDQHGEKFKLSQSLKRTKAPHLIYFYP